MNLRLSIERRPRKPLPLAVPVFQTEGGPAWGRGQAALPPALLKEARDDGFAAKGGETHLFHPRDGRPAERMLLVGLGKKSKADGSSVRLYGAALARRLAEVRWPAARVHVPDDVVPLPEAVQAVAEGLSLADYRFDRHKSARPPQGGVRHFFLSVTDRAPKTLESRLNRGLLMAEAVRFARDLINEPPSRKTPVALGRAARELSGGPVRVRVYDKAALGRMGAEALLGVNRGSAHPPVLVHLHYRPVRQSGTAPGGGRPAGKPLRRLAFVGKGITFDSGGLSLKTADGMAAMKYDMAGAATVFSLFKVLPRLAPRLEVHGIAPLTENMPGPDAYKPGDVVRALNGKTIEILNTDAEGRVVLADALSFASRLPADEIIDVATLTGAVTVALGKSYAALMTNTPRLEEGLRRAASAAGEKLWPLPLEASYREHFRSKVADVKNIGNAGEAGTIIGGLFLQEFVGEKPWAHVDMAGVGWNAAGSPLSAPGATGAIVRTFLNYILEADA